MLCYACLLGYRPWTEVYAELKFVYSPSSTLLIRRVRSIMSPSQHQQRKPLLEVFSQQYHNITLFHLPSSIFPSKSWWSISASTSLWTSTQWMADTTSRRIVLAQTAQQYRKVLASAHLAINTRCQHAIGKAAAGAHLVYRDKSLLRMQTCVALASCDLEGRESGDGRDCSGVSTGEGMGYLLLGDGLRREATVIGRKQDMDYEMVFFALFLVIRVS